MHSFTKKYIADAMHEDSESAVCESDRMYCRSAKRDVYATAYEQVRSERVIFRQAGVHTDASLQGFCPAPD